VLLEVTCEKRSMQLGMANQPTVATTKKGKTPAKSQKKTRKGGRGER
jgi:hypothetical protein